MIWFATGLILGGIIGFSIMCFMVIASRGEDDGDTM